MYSISKNFIISNPMLYNPMLSDPMLSNPMLSDLHCFFSHRKSVPAAMIAGVMGQFLASPTDLVKIKLQVEGKRVMEGHPPRLAHLGK